MERELIVNQGTYSFDSHANNIVVEIDREFAKLCSVLEMQGVRIEGKTVLQFEAAIETLLTKNSKNKTDTA